MNAARYAALFQSESHEHLDELDVALLALERVPDSTEAVRHLATLFRSMHTIKGMAAAMSYTGVEALAHALESRCEPLRSGSERLCPEVLTLLFDGTRALRQSVDDVALGRTSSDDPAFLALLRRLGTCSPNAAACEVFPTRESSSRPGGIAALESGAGGAGSTARATAPEPSLGSRVPEAPRVRVIDVRLADTCQLKGVRALIVIAKLRALTEVSRTEPPEHRWQEASFDGVFRVFVAATDATAVTDAAIAEAVRSAGEISAVQVGVEQPKQEENPLPVRTVRLDAHRLDTLLDLVGELVISRDRLLRAIEGMPRPDRAVLAAAREAARLVGTLQEEVLQARLQPVSQVFDRFPRLVRDVARDLGKEVEFTMEGREIEMDRALLDVISEPILHLLRNAMDHGIEDAERRRSAGKPERGALILRAARDRSSIVIQVQDDGRGIDRLAVLRRAQHQGLVPSHLSTLTDEALLPLVSRAGFSTAQSVSTLSGRGVGVDIVSTRVRALGGQLELETLEGEGTVFTLRLPATLAITRALLVTVQGTIFALPAANVEEAMAYHAGLEVRTTDRSMVTTRAITLRDEIIPLVALADHFRLGESQTGRETYTEGELGCDQHLAIVEVGGRRAALLVDALVAQQDVVVKSLATVQGAAPWFSGATVLGDGTPALIVDVSSFV